MFLQITDTVKFTVVSRNIKSQLFLPVTGRGKTPKSQNNTIEPIEAALAPATSISGDVFEESVTIVR